MPTANTNVPVANANVPTADANVPAANNTDEVLTLNPNDKQVLN
ncbi:hypothetical protein MY11210_006768 [Beauveria gryllotalpidicola]